MHELPPTGVRGRVGISFKLGVIVLLRLPLFHRHMRLFVYYLGLFVYYLGFRETTFYTKRITKKKSINYLTWLRDLKTLYIINHGKACLK